MLQIKIPDGEIFDESTSRIIRIKGRELQLEHSLVSISKWESKWKKPFLGLKPKTREETIDYIRCMTITQNIQPDVFSRLTLKNIQEAVSYWMKAAKEGDASAMYRLGDCNRFGWGMPENLQKAIKWYSFAAEYGYEEAQEALNEIL